MSDTLQDLLLHADPGRVEQGVELWRALGESEQQALPWRPMRLRSWGGVITVAGPNLPRCVIPKAQVVTAHGGTVVLRWDKFTGRWRIPFPRPGIPWNDTPHGAASPGALLLHLGGEHCLATEGAALHRKEGGGYEVDRDCMVNPIMLEPL